MVVDLRERIVKLMPGVIKVAVYIAFLSIIGSDLLALKKRRTSFEILLALLSISKVSFFFKVHCDVQCMESHKNLS